MIGIYVAAEVRGSEAIHRRDAENAELDEGETSFCFFLCGSLRFSAYFAPLR